MSDFNINLWKCDQHSPANEFLDSLSFHMLMPHVVQPTRERNNSKTLNDKIYLDVITPDNMSGNPTATIFDHLPQIFIAPDIFLNSAYKQ